MTNAFDGYISKLGTAEERNSKLEDILIETSIIEKHRDRDQGLKKI